MADSLSVTFRPLYLEDLGTSATLAQTTDTVMGLGQGTTVTPIVTAGSDTAAVAAGLNTGDVYLNTGAIPYRLRANGVNGTGGAVTKLTGSASLASPGAIANGSSVTAGTITVVGALVGDSVIIGSVAVLATGLIAFGKVFTAGVVTVEVHNMSGASATPPTATYTALILH